MDLLLILFGIYLIFRFMKNTNTPSSKDEKFPSMTETQRRWHELKNQKTSIQPENQLTIMDLEEYIRTNIKPFSFNDWLFKPIHPKMKSYACTIIITSYILPIIVGLVSFAFFSVYIPAIYIFICAIFGDYMIYTVSRRYDVVYNDPEFRNKFSHFFPKDEI